MLAHINTDSDWCGALSVYEIEINTSIKRAKVALEKPICQLFEIKRFFDYCKFYSGMCCAELFHMGRIAAALCKSHSNGLNCPGEVRDKAP